MAGVLFTLAVPKVNERLPAGELQRALSLPTAERASTPAAVRRPASVMSCAMPAARPSVRSSSCASPRVVANIAQVSVVHGARGEDRSIFVEQPPAHRRKRLLCLPLPAGRLLRRGAPADGCVRHKVECARHGRLRDGRTEPATSGRRMNERRNRWIKLSHARTTLLHRQGRRSSPQVQVSEQNASSRPRKGPPAEPPVASSQNTLLPAFCARVQRLSAREPPGLRAAAAAGQRNALRARLG